jgi:REP element-mobilizing transposase RayT
LVNSLKAFQASPSSQPLKAEFPALSTVWSVRKSEGALGSPRDFVGSVAGAPIENLRQSIENQGRSQPPA